MIEVIWSMVSKAAERSSKQRHDAFICNDSACNYIYFMCVSVFRYSYYGHQVVNNVYGAGSGAIFMDGVDCTGSETSLADCNHWGWGSHSCGHSSDVAIECNVPMTFAVGMNIVVYNVQIIRK